MTQRVTMDPTPAKSIQAAKRGLSRSLLRNPGVSGVGIVDAEGGHPSIMVYLREDSPQVRSLVPQAVDGYPVVVETVGPIQARM